MKIQKESHPICESEYEYLIKAQQFGFFQEGFIQDNITSCDDWVVAVWIKELNDKYKKDENLFLNEVLPNFKKWLSTDRRLKKYSGVGYGYEVLSLTQEKGVEINYSSVQMLVGTKLFEKISSALKYGIENNLAKFKIDEIFRNIVFFNECGIPFGSDFGNYYQELVNFSEKLLSDGKPLNYSLLVFLDTCTSGKYNEFYELQKRISREYNYETCNCQEMKMLSNFMSGCNKKVIDDLTLEKDKVNERIDNLLDTERDRIYDTFAYRIGEKCKISYLEISEDGSVEKREFEGEIVAIDSTGVNLVNENGRPMSFLGPRSVSIPGDNFERQYICLNAMIGKKRVYSLSINKREQLVRLYSNKYKKERELRHWINAGDVLKRYYEKYGTIEGAAYLTNSISMFLDIVKDGEVPINNLFASIFEEFYNFGERENILEYSLITYEHLLGVTMPFPREYYEYRPSNFYPIGTDYDNLSLQAYTYGFDIKKFVSSDLQKYIRNYTGASWVIERMKDGGSDFGPRDAGRRH